MSPQHRIAAGLAAAVLMLLGAYKYLPQELEAAPKAVITGPNTANPGDRIVLDATGSVGKHFRWRIVPTVQGRDHEEISSGGHVCTLPSYAGRYWVRLVVSNSLGSDEKEWTVTVGAGQPAPAPAPGPMPPGPVNPDPPVNPPLPPPSPPPPPVKPELPAGQFGLAREVRDAGMQVQSAARADEAHRLAKAFGDMADAIDAGKLSGEAEQATALRIQTALTKAATEALGASRLAWASFHVTLSKRISQLYNDHLVRTPAQWSAAFREIKAGLEAVS